jgi:hypothetical protein
LLATALLSLHHCSDNSFLSFLSLRRTIIMNRRRQGQGQGQSKGKKLFLIHRNIPHPEKKRSQKEKDAINPRSHKTQNTTHKYQNKPK